ncbi:amino acid ABC transporter membrane protein 1 (PAAT family) [Herbihabitans rhizosphaerae]|uniref:Amino acid ABC transporter membrane protein 1 (PAAT family) n=1 Tax=Herbihabitans rhizosphaerae TaxID=1872711 RepID=A0A4V2ERM2_9PSEU|nr:ectoine/hydroxyectoine ABC transporter permease subunit EhuC [Herbihabitans rhizosphaerae]RZS32439.1 amino acid ABC transporter membrane protein 1 (PAAT family) [Herbihabitans rhizosphaerae]
MLDNFGYFWEVVLKGLPYTVYATLGGIAITIVLSVIAGLALLSGSRTVRFISRIYVEGFRGTSELVQLFWIALALPILIGFQLVPLWAGILVLGLNHGAYGAEVVRGAVQSVPKAQVEGAVALNFTPAQRMRRVILPQAFIETLPPFNNLFIQLLKSTALLALVSVPEMTKQAEELRPIFGGQVGVIYLIILVLYFALSVVITFVMRLLERAAARRLGRRPVKHDTLSDPLAGMPVGGSALGGKP